MEQIKQIKQIEQLQNISRDLKKYKNTLIKSQTSDKGIIPDLLNKIGIDESERMDEDELPRKKVRTTNIPTEIPSNNNPDDKNIFMKSKNIYNLLIKIEDVKNSVEKFQNFMNVKPV